MTPPLDFGPIELDRRQDYLAQLARCTQVASDYSFLNLWGWAEEYGLEWAWDGELVWIRQRNPQPAWWAPVGDWQAVDWSARLAVLPAGTEFIRVPEALAAAWAAALGPQVAVEEQRGQWDYLYRRQDLVELKGNRLHKKKNLLNQFLRKYDFEYEDFGPRLVEQARAMQEDWCTWRDCESSEVLAAENRAILRVLDCHRHFEDLLGGALFVEGVIVAYTLAEPLTDDTLVIHFEKGCPDYKGVYQAINQIFLSRVPQRFSWVNREQDLDNQGLRKAKLSYQPAAFLKKSRVVLTG